MKKKTVLVMMILLALLLFVPIPTGVYKDGGTRTYTALTYKAVKWNRATAENCRYTKLSLYGFPDNFKSIDELWDMEQAKLTK